MTKAEDAFYKAAASGKSVAEVLSERLIAVELERDAARAELEKVKLDFANACDVGRRLEARCAALAKDVDAGAVEVDALRARVLELETALEALVTLCQEHPDFTNPGDPDPFAALKLAEAALAPSPAAPERATPEAFAHLEELDAKAREQSRRLEAGERELDTLLGASAAGGVLPVPRRFPLGPAEPRCDGEDCEHEPCCFDVFEFQRIQPPAPRLTLFEAARRMPSSVLVSPTPVTPAKPPACPTCQSYNCKETYRRTCTICGVVFCCDNKHARYCCRPDCKPPCKTCGGARKVWNGIPYVTQPSCMPCPDCNGGAK